MLYEVGVEQLPGRGSLARAQLHHPLPLAAGFIWKHL